MEINVNQESWNFKEWLKFLVVSLFVIIGTFPQNDWTFTYGIDPPLQWVFNYFLQNGFELGKHIIFPHGPLAFFMYPIQDNILLVTIVNTILKALIVFNIAQLLAQSKSIIKWTIAFIVTYLISIIAGFNHLALANIILLYCNSYQSNKKIFKLIAFIITALVFYVKAYVAITSGFLFASFEILLFAKSKKIKTAIIDSLLLLFFILLFWMAMYHSFSGFPDYIIGIIQLAQDNSSAAAYYPYNNWVLLGFFFALMVALVYLNKSEKSFFYWVLIGFSIFAAWKHGMAREDASHVNGFLTFIIICFAVFLIFNKEKLILNLTLSVVATLLFSMNMKNSVNYEPKSYSLFTATNFIEFATDYFGLKQKAISETEKYISEKKLSKNFTDKISASTIDVYPWDYSYIPANHLKWQPRVVLHSYASYTTWLDLQNAKHFRSEKAPEFILIERSKWSNVNGGSFTSIDSRYFLNDEPQTMLTLLENYKYAESDSKTLLIQKRANPIKSAAKIIQTNNSEWNKWIDAPKYNNELIRAKLHFENSFLQKLKSFFYKDEQFWIYLKLENNSIHKYRIVPKNAADGIWINPYFFDEKTKYIVKEIMFKCSNQSLLKQDLTVEWEEIKFDAEKNCVANFFNIQNTQKDSILISTINDFEKSKLSNWSELMDEQTAEICFEGSKSQLLKPQAYSVSYSISLDSLPQQDLKISVESWIKAPDYKLTNKAALIISIEDSTGSILWTNANIDAQLIDGNQWNHIYHYTNYKNTKPNCILKIYFFNDSTEEIIIDNFKVSILKFTFN
jgi:hypothetical protein